ncbi:2Fe-2S iron-sulfur cluster-binding protein [Bifidobacterium sp. ESL0745]|uniref:succinate dehydrogenase/fumarate reductase iron-sulfur subunit n=1 Tax=Bifidobacterium sp. ESL0745 TaxID=2983226 RepID=UPI0023FA1C83|nr:2Fe-2S iron-sulfur cluster-binding protein [Bifidobacterium sp. ESL0745]MDF7665282.1 2Fe-2S iron-sulfur cluster-binding protein [Bifidobacterium sp. ESL0745]
MSEDAMQGMNVTIRIQRFAPAQERERPRRHSSSPFGSKARGGSPFGSSPSSRRVRGKHWTQDYTIGTRPGQTLLDCLLNIKRDIDPTLAFRYSCGHGICGSDAVSINGTPTLLCTAKVEDYAKAESNPGSDANAIADAGFRSTTSTGSKNTAGTGVSNPDTNAPFDGNTYSHPDLNAGGNQSSTDVNKSSSLATNQDVQSSLDIIEIAPLPGFQVQRDLIVDIDQMMNQIKRLEPYLKADGKLATTKDGKIDMFEYLQRPEALKRYELLSNCISCGVCEGSCPVYAGGEAFIGPAALIAASRFINDSRDNATGERLDAIATVDGITACQSVRACSRKCPRGIDVGEEMWQLTERVKNRQN